MDAQEKSFDLVVSTTRLMITLGTAFISFSVVLLKELGVISNLACAEKILWSTASFFVVLSIAAGVWTLLGLMTVLQPKQANNPNLTIRRRTISLPFQIQIVTFGLSMGFVFLLGLASLFK